MLQSLAVSLCEVLFGFDEYMKLIRVLVLLGLVQFFSLVLRLFCFASFLVSMLSLKPRPFVQSSFDMQAFR